MKIKFVINQELKIIETKYKSNTFPAQLTLQNEKLHIG